MESENRSRLLPVLIVLILFLVSLGCNIAKLVSDQIDLDRTVTAQAREIEWAKSATEEARLYNNTTATAQQRAKEILNATQTAVLKTEKAEYEAHQQTEAAPKPPIITSIDFPAEIPGNRSTIIGLLYFQDPDGDIKQVNYTVIRAKEFGGGVDDHPALDHGTWTDGAIKVYLWCEGEQTVTLEATLLDFAGNASNPMRFTFTCK